MSYGTSWDARGADLSRIRLALKNGDVKWDERCRDWVAHHLDRTRYGTDEVVRLMHKHIAAGGRVKGQRNAPGNDFHVWFSIELELDSVVRFIKFGIEPEDDENPGLQIISIHPPH